MPRAIAEGLTGGRSMRSSQPKVALDEVSAKGSKRLNVQRDTKRGAGVLECWSAVNKPRSGRLGILTVKGGHGNDAGSQVVVVIKNEVMMVEGS